MNDEELYFDNSALSLRQRSLIKSLLVLATAGLLVLAACFGWVARMQNYVYPDYASYYESKHKNIAVAIVFGGGVSPAGQPLPLLKLRLNTAAKLLHDGYVHKILLSGDNRYVDYNEPQAMLNYLVATGIDVNKLQMDSAGRTTFETCERAKKVFGIHKALLVSESTHLTRAVFLCRQFNIEAYGISSDTGDNRQGPQIGQRFREVLASSKAVFNAYVIGEKTILGPQIPFDN